MVCLSVCLSLSLFPPPPFSLSLSLPPSLLLPGSVTDYRPPFDEMVPPNPSINDMKRVVVDGQKRPVIPKAFTNNSVS